MAEERIDFRLRHLVGQGVNFCFYLLGKAQLRLPGLGRVVLWPAPNADPFADFARRFDTAGVGELEPLQVEPLWRPWLEAVAQSCPDSAADALSALPDLPARPQVRTAFQRYGRVQLNDFLERWTGIKLDLEGRLTQALRTFDTPRILARHQAAVGVEYRPGRAAFHYHLLRVFSATRFGSSFVLGGAYLEQPARLADVVAHGTLHTLVAQTEVWEREDTRPLVQAMSRALSGSDLDARDAIEETVCVLIGVLEHEGEAAPLERIEARTAHPVLRLIARALYEHRRTRHSQGFPQWIVAALQQAARSRLPAAR